MKNGKSCCGKCRYAWRESELDFVCKNEESDYYSDFIEFDHCCECFAGKERKS